ncbi:hypothetical protein PCAR4_1270019 [Paraburkholderia caribensis]|jgi:hypothetical protein|nr:hypothetical protein PCAR4_1270019 [Paraburkholderia caribensis]
MWCGKKMGLADQIRAQGYADGEFLSEKVKFSGKPKTVAER